MTLKTQFVSDSLLVWCPFTQNEPVFWFDGNGKITAENGTFTKPAANAFSLVHIEDCPYRTPVCESKCYVHRLEENESEMYEKYRQNSKTIRRVLSNPYQTNKTIEAFADWINAHCKKGGFRWHVSGDIFSIEYAWFIRGVVYKTSSIRHWLYTRSFLFSETLYGLSNLVVNLSADRDNFDEALACHNKFGFRICFMVTEGDTIPDLPEGSVIFPSHELRGRDLESPTDAVWWKSLSLKQKRMVCPPDFFGQSEALRCGPCNKCLI
ncbi:MAG: hypothetical protein HZC03_01780 [Candidatus Lloydbacteria bacterium]|nr:hypothetical protein [Candidatus Lloydbacteria bacterium]